MCLPMCGYAQVQVPMKIRGAEARLIGTSGLPFLGVGNQTQYELLTAKEPSLWPHCCCYCFNM